MNEQVNTAQRYNSVVRFLDKLQETLKAYASSCDPK